MAIRWWDPMGDVAHMHRTMDRVFDQFLGGGGSGSPPPGQGEPVTYYLPLDILETEGEYTLQASVPGFTPEQVEVTFADGVLTIAAMQAAEAPPGEWIRRERPSGNWTRRLQLPGEIQSDRIAATFDNGVLTVSIPKASRPKPVKIAVGAGRKVLAGSN